MTGPEPDSGLPTRDPEVRASLDRYWRSNVRLTLILLVIWAVAGLVLGVLVVDKLNVANLPGTGYPLGFWFAQQGSIYAFVVLIFVYVWKMNQLDRKYDFHEE